MADTIIPKILGQEAPTTAAGATLYTVPDMIRAQVQSLYVCNRDAAADFSISVTPKNEVTAPKHYIFYNQPIAKNVTYSTKHMIFLNEGDVVAVISTSPFKISFTIFGQET